VVPARSLVYHSVIAGLRDRYRETSVVTQKVSKVPLVELQIKHNPQGGVNAAHFFEAEITHAVAEATRIDCRGLFSQHPRDSAVDVNFWPKARGPSRCRCGRY
jgi:hypothetical protein